MIARLCGSIVEKGVDGVVIDAGGVGYQVQVSLNTLARLPDVGAKATVIVHTQVREDAITLFGFADHIERDVFRLLLSVAGIGPKVALTLLSGLPPAELAEAVRAGDVRGLTRIPGIGKKTAERVVLELAERLPSSIFLRAASDEAAPQGSPKGSDRGAGGEGIYETTETGTGAGAVAGTGAGTGRGTERGTGAGRASPDAFSEAVRRTGAVLRELAEALESLGFKPAEIDRTIKTLRKPASEGMPLEALIREALRR